MKILVAEDEALIALDIMLLLTKAGAEVIGPAMNVDRALELAGGEDLNCGVLDVRLRNKYIFPAADLLFRKGVEVVFHTGEPHPEAIKREWPNARVLMKPAPLLTLMKTVVEACAESQKRDTDTHGGAKIAPEDASAARLSIVRNSAISLWPKAAHDAMAKMA